MGRKYSFGKRVREIMEDKGMTKDDLAERLGDSARTARRYTSDSKIPGKCAIRKLSNALEVDPKVLLMNTSDYKRYKSGEEEDPVVCVEQNEHSSDVRKPEVYVEQNEHSSDVRKPDVMMVWFGGIIYGYRDDQ